MMKAKVRTEFFFAIFLWVFFLFLFVLTCEKYIFCQWIWLMTGWVSSRQWKVTAIFNGIKRKCIEFVGEINFLFNPWGNPWCIHISKRCIEVWNTMWKVMGRGQNIWKNNERYFELPLMENRYADHKILVSQKSSNVDERRQVRKFISKCSFERRSEALSTL